MIESFADVPLPGIIKSYLYLQYSDDADLQAFVAAYNSVAQGYLDWFNQTPLGLYTSPHVYGNLLDWIGNGIYGIPRPVLGSGTARSLGEMNSTFIDRLAINEELVISTGQSQIATDDIYKRVLTWILYRGDGKQPSVSWLRRRITRFLYGANGGDIPQVLYSYVKTFSGAGYNSVPYNTEPYNGTLETFTDIPVYEDLTQNVSLDFGEKINYRAGYLYDAYNTVPYNGFTETITYLPHHVNITIPTSQIAQAFKALLEQNLLPFPFQMTAQVSL